jgi:phage tail-like protein
MGLAATQLLSRLSAAGTALIGSASGVTARPDGTLDPVPVFAFHVEIDGIIEASFISCSGLNVTREVTALKEGGMNDGQHWIHTGLSFGKITLESGVTHSDALWRWFNTGAEDGKLEFKDFFIIQIVPYTDDVARRYSIQKGLPTAWTGPSLNTSGAEAAVEKLEIAFTRFTLATS